MCCQKLGRSCRRILRKKNKKRQHGAKAEPKLDTARRLRGICYVDPDGMEFKQSMKRAKKLDARMASAMPCEARSTPGKKSFMTPKGPSEFARGTQHGKRDALCIVDEHRNKEEEDHFLIHALLKPTKPQAGAPKGLENEIMDITLMKGVFFSLTPYCLARKPMPMPLAMKIPDATAAVDKE